MPKITKKGALEVTAALDRVANLFQEEFEALGVPKRVAFDFARRCDMLSDHVERVAGLKRVALTGDGTPKNQNDGFDPEEIGREDAGPVESVDKDEPYMKGEFTQQENRELRERVEAEDLGPDTNPESQAPSVGKQASLLRRQMQAAVLAGASPRVVKALALAAKIAEEAEDDKGEDEETKVEASDNSEDKAEDKSEAGESKTASHGFKLFA